jgi:hypothetical protein
MKTPALPTRVSRADWEEHDYFGWKLFADLGGKETLAGMLALAATGTRLDPDDRAVIDDVASINAAADPRIWPLKVVRVASAYGRILPAAAVGTLFFESDTVGSMLGSKLAAVLVAIRADLGEDFGDDALEARVRRQLSGRERLPGFGVPFRPHDERLVALESILRARGRDRLPHYRIFRKLADVMREQRGIEPNALGGIAAALLDAKVPADRVGVLLYALVQYPQLANAVEGAAQAPELLRKLPEECIEYRGPSPRVSPRAQVKS